MHRIGILSFAHGHVNSYAAQILTFPDAQLVGAWDHDSERGIAQCKQFDIPFYKDIDEFLALQHLDCVIVASETNRHTDLCIRAMEAGKAVLLQKPMAITLADCDRIIETANRTGVWFSLAFQMRCDPQNIKMRELVQSGSLGKIGLIRRRHCIPVLFHKSFYEGGSKWHIDPVANKGMFFDDAIHPFDWLLWTTGRKPTTVYAEIDNVLTNVAPDDTGIALFRFDDGLMAEVTNSSVTWAAENTTEIYGDKGVLIQNFGDAPSCQYQPENAAGLKLFLALEPEKGWQVLDVPTPKSHGERIAGVARPFIDSLSAGVPMCTAEEGRISVELSLACYHASSNGSKVIFPFSE